MLAEISNRTEPHCKTEFEILVEPNTIDEFRKTLNLIVLKKSGFAILHGKDNRLS
jgi:hypothetical protein